MKKMFWFILAGSLALGVSCRLYNLERRLNPDDADFLSKVRYIITSKEKKIFLELPDSEKAGFQEDFWRRRDPDPTTEENEFKIEYYQRIDRADELFHGEGKPGWLTDRGRIFVLFGPPMDRSTYSREINGFCREVWYYGNFPVVFVDERCSGSYILTAINLEHLQEINRAQARSQQTIQDQEKKPLFDYAITVRKDRLDQDRYEGTLVIQIPYANLWFIFKEGKLETVLDIQAELKSATGDLLWETRREFKLVVEEEELKAQKDKNYALEIPIVLDENMEAVRSGKCQLLVSLKTSTESGLKKAVDFRLD